MSIKILRQERHWSQEQLSEFSGLNVRTIQRIENGQTASIESLKALASVFEVEVDSLQKNYIDEDKDTELDNKLMKEKAIEHVENIKIFYLHISTYFIVNLVLFGVNMMLTPNVAWWYLVAVLWIIGIALHALWVFGAYRLFNSDWEQKKIEEKLGNKRQK